MEQKYYGIVYKITNLINGKSYGGQTTRNMEVRGKEHLQNSRRKKPNSLISRAIKKYGWENFTVEVLFYAFDKISLDENEINFIKEIKGRTTENGYNLTKGGDGTCGYKHTEETRRKIGETHKNKIVSTETRQKLSLSRKDKSCSEETRQKLSSVHKGSLFSEEHKRKIGEANKKRLWTEESRQKSSDAQTKQPVIQLSVFGEYIAEYTSVKDAERATGVDDGNICKVCQGKFKQAGGFQWRYGTRITR